MSKERAVDLNRAARKDVPLWSETRWAGSFNPDQGVGLFIHVGRLRGDLDWWWAQTVIYLPESRFAVDRSWVREPRASGVQTPTLSLELDAHGWSAQFDGIVQLTDTDGLARAPRGAGAPCAHARFDIVADNSRPLWDMYAQTVGHQSFAGDMHIEQMGRSTGTLSVGTAAFSLDGVSYSDHSCGARDLTKFHAYDFLNVAMPDLSVHVLRVLSPEGRPLATFGAWSEHGGQQLGLEAAELPRPADLYGAPRDFELALTLKGGRKQQFRVEILQTFTYTITNDNDNYNGTDWEIEGDPLICVDSQAKITAIDGAIGYATISRGDRRSKFRNPNTD